MKVAINLLQLPPGRVEGVVTYARKLIENLPAYCTDGELIVIRQPGLDLGALDPSVTVIDVEPPSFSSRAINRFLTMSRLRVMPYGTWKLSRLLKSHDVDMVHYLLSTIPASDFSLKLPIILSFMDMQHEFQPENFSQAELIQRRSTFRPSAERADKIISISQHATQSLIEKFKIPASKITTIYLAGDLSKKLKKVPGLPKEYLFYPAADWTHKNHLRLLDAMAQLKAEGFEGHLVLTGFRSEKAAAIHAHIKKLDIEDQVTDLGPVTFDELAYVHRHAKMLVCPSRFEGFGIPPIEAMSAGTPVACSNTTSLPEVVGEAAITFDPESVKEIKEAIKKLWNDKNLRDELIKRGHKQAKKFSWEIMAQQTYNVYKEVYAKSKKQSEIS